MKISFKTWNPTKVNFIKMKLLNLFFCLAYGGDFHQRRRFHGFHTKRFIKSAQFNDDDRTNWTQGCNLWLNHDHWPTKNFNWWFYCMEFIQEEFEFLDQRLTDRQRTSLSLRQFCYSVRNKKISTVYRFKILSLIFWTPYDMFEDEPEFKLNILCIRYVYICHKIL